MKLDKFMEHCYKIMCIVVACVVAFGSVVSCFNKPVKVSAAGEGEVGELIERFWDVYWQNADVILYSIIQDIQSGNTSATSDIAKQRLKQIGIQMLLKQYDPRYFYLDYPEQFTFDSVSGCSGYYISANDGFYHPIFVNGIYPYDPDTSISSAVEWTLCSSDEFTVTGLFSGDSVRFQTASSSSGSYSGIRLYPVSGFQNGSITLNSTDYFNFTSVTRSGRLSYLWHSFDCRVSFASSPPLLRKDVFRNFTSSSSLDDAGFAVMVGGYGVDVSLPGGTIDTNAPWDYYNQVILPYIKTIIPTYEPDYFIFPDGYSPPLQPDPTEPGTMPSGGISIGSNNNIDIDINVYYPTDESGQPITDESGETVTETYYVTDTTPTDVVYKFTIPTLPNLDRYSDTLPAMNLAQFESGINFIFSAADGIFTDTGFLPVIIVTLSLCALCYVIWKIGG